MLINGIYDSDLELSLVGKVQSDKWSYGPLWMAENKCLNGVIT